MQSKIKSLIALLILVSTISCVQETHIKEIYFEVDTRGAAEIGSLGVRGSLPPLSWNETTELSDPDADGIYTGKILVDTGQSSMSFKFVTEADNFELANKDNRTLIFQYKPEVIKYVAIWNNPEATIVVE